MITKRNQEFRNSLSTIALLENKISFLELLCKKLYDCMDMQLKRESGAFFITSEVALDIWFEAMNQYNDFFKNPKVDIKDYFNEDAPETSAE